MREFGIFLVLCLVLPGILAQSPGNGTAAACSKTNPCGNFGTCILGTCYCNSFFTGVRCEIPKNGYKCDQDAFDCGANGICLHGVCVCKENFTGSQCDVFDTTAVCPTIEVDDLEFFPTCSFKTTLTNLSACINADLPYTNVGLPVNICRSKMLNTIGCMGRVTEQCFGRYCDSVWWNEKMSSWLESFFEVLLDPNSEEFGKLSDAICAGSSDGKFLMPNITFDIGAPVCDPSTIDDLIELYVTTGNDLLDGKDQCSALEHFKMQIFNVTRDQCDWANISHVVKNDSDLMPFAWQFTSYLMTAHAMLPEWVIPECKKCSSLQCMNNGTCFVASNYMEYCNCPWGFTGMRCEVSTGCNNLTCQNGGTCYRTGDGMERCFCGDGFIGLTCDVVMGRTCSDLMCENGGYCDDSGGFAFCACNPGFSGTRCQHRDDMHQCPTVSSDDSLFLPLCTLKTALAHMSECVNAYLPYMYPGGDRGRCRHNITSTVGCWSVVTLECSRSTCPSIWLLPGAQNYSTHIFTTLYDMESDFMQALVPFLCSDIGQDGMYHLPQNFNFDLGFGICGSSFTDSVLRLVVTSANEVLMNQQLPAVCSSLDRLRSGIYEAFGTCNFHQILMHLPNDLRPFGSQIISALNVSREYFQEWVIPMCRGIDGGGFDVCPQLTGYSSPCQFAEAWMCEYKNFRRHLVDWRMQFKDWWMSCTNFHMRDWRDWNPMGAPMHGGQASWNMRDMTGWDGFQTIWDQSFACPEWHDVRCAGGRQATMWRDGMRCGFPVCPGGSYANPRMLFMRYQMERQYYSKMMAMYKTLISECSSGSSFASCGIGDSGGSGGGDFSTTTSWGGDFSTTTASWHSDYWTGPGPTFTTSTFGVSPTMYPGSDSPATTRNPGGVVSPTMHPGSDSPATTRNPGGGVSATMHPGSDSPATTTNPGGSTTPGGGDSRPSGTPPVSPSL